MIILYSMNDELSPNDIYQMQYLNLLRLFLLNVEELTDRAFQEQYYENQIDYVKRLRYYYHVYLYLSSQDRLNDAYISKLNEVKRLIDGHAELGYPLKKRLLGLFMHYGF